MFLEVTLINIDARTSLEFPPLSLYRYGMPYDGLWKSKKWHTLTVYGVFPVNASQKDVLQIEYEHYIIIVESDQQRRAKFSLATDSMEWPISSFIVTQLRRL